MPMWRPVPTLFLFTLKRPRLEEIIGFVKAWDFSAPLVIVPTSYPMLSVDEVNKLGVKMVIYHSSLLPTL